VAVLIDVAVIVWSVAGRSWSAIRQQLVATLDCVSLSAAASTQLQLQLLQAPICLLMSSYLTTWATVSAGEYATCWTSFFLFQQAL